MCVALCCVVWCCVVLFGVLDLIGRSYEHWGPVRANPNPNTLLRLNSTYPWRRRTLAISVGRHIKLDHLFLTLGTFLTRLRAHRLLEILLVCMYVCMYVCMFRCVNECKHELIAVLMATPKYPTLIPTANQPVE